MKKYRCADCGSTDVEVCLPGWFNPNKNLRFIDCDAEAEELAVYCNDCGDTHGVIAPNGKVITGRWK